jgi:hypothetical protein
VFNPNAKTGTNAQGERKLRIAHSSSVKLTRCA